MFFFSIYQKIETRHYISRNTLIIARISYLLEKFFYEMTRTCLSVSIGRNKMVSVGLFVRMQAKPGKEADVENFLRGGLPLVQGVNYCGYF